MRRFFTENEFEIGSSISLCGNEARHISTVLRLSAGDEILLINGSGYEARAVIEGFEGDAVLLKIIEKTQCEAEPENSVTLFQGLPKAGKLDLIVQKCVELGVTEIQPVSMLRCVAKPERNDNKLVRLNRISHEAAKQCGRSHAPAVLAPIALDKCDFSSFDLVLVAYEDEHKTTLKSVLSEFKHIKTEHSSIAIIIGPEGGFDEREVEAILSSNKNAYSVSLGKRILRTETAGMALLAMLMYELEG